MLSEKYLRNVPLPEGLTQKNIFDALQRTQELFKMIRENTGLNLSTIIQANNFSGIVSNVFTKKLSDISIYRANNERTYPDLLHESKSIGLEVKATKKSFKGGEGHNGHSGWHIIICYKIFSNGDIEFIQVEIAELIGYEFDNSDWKYLGSQRNQNNSQRTETYVTNNIGTAKLRDGIVYLNTDEIKITSQLKKNREKLSSVLPIPKYSPFA
ncbi:MAG: hypothetical protein IKK13_00580 [Clostridia bacterium]|nr:hypothetical protein [Selenomonadaceae bacterium]MBR3050833.1 hypothetical protein [Selenomonadaceae bacterium]MBR3960690.1 hypothetical protein [Clostridia bacterium]